MFALRGNSGRSTRPLVPLGMAHQDGVAVRVPVSATWRLSADAPVWLLACVVGWRRASLFDIHEKAGVFDWHSGYRGHCVPGAGGDPRWLGWRHAGPGGRSDRWDWWV